MTATTLAVGRKIRECRLTANLKIADKPDLLSYEEYIYCAEVEFVIKGK